MNIDNRRARTLGITAGVAAGVAISLAAASPAAAAAPPSVKKDTLIVNGSGQDDTIALRLVGGTLRVEINGSVEGNFALSTFSKLEVLLRNGDDRVDIDPGFTVEQATINGGKGNDILNGGDSAELFIGGRGNDSVDGNRGNDTADLGSGEDRFTWDPGDGSDAIDGGGGTDTLDFNGAAGVDNMSLSPSGNRAVFFRQQGNINMDMIRVEQLDLDALGNADTVTINDMSGTDFRLADVDLGGADAAIDTVTVNGTNNADDIDVTAQGASVVVAGLQTETRITGS
ncbi:MAG TPA: hypothetical protein VFY84_00310, partial [Jiangellales bacterium]|nr:hypothetical protein [Jiangellales bacterium]